MVLHQFQNTAEARSSFVVFMRLFSFTLLKFTSHITMVFRRRSFYIDNYVNDGKVYDFLTLQGVLNPT